MQSMNISKDNFIKLEESNRQDSSVDHVDHNIVSESRAVGYNLDIDDKHVEQGDKMNKHGDLDFKAKEEMNETTKDLVEEEPEPIFDGTEVPGMQANRNSSTRSLDPDLEEEGSLWPEKAVALKHFVKEKGAAVTSVLRRLSFKRDGVEQAIVDVYWNDNLHTERSTAELVYIQLRYGTRLYTQAQASYKQLTPTALLTN
ncbi:hypothetical protein F3Y22_tig00110174pilonHSYRG00435 [Hibiscus syriacus]|uniref:Uncharacterized protein n=1 Tax=Hibiscus syriacus TaxID=106335 RepID=A0A6A3BHC4_HIBSY|nr:hypothetical protein F3Y22_tig00110174pilonHSYRG00435 [Hibiscus syriacus]